LIIVRLDYLFLINENVIKSIILKFNIFINKIIFIMQRDEMKHDIYFNKNLIKNFQQFFYFDLIINTIFILKIFLILNIHLYSLY